MEWLAGRGARIYVPVGQSPDLDLVAPLDRRLIGVEVKTSIFRPARTWQVALATRGGNQSWSGFVKRFDHQRCDFLFVHVGDGRRWFIPASEIEGRTSLHLGGTKYAEFEVERGRPLGRDANGARLQSRSPGEYPSGQRGCAVNAVALPSQVRILPPPSQDERRVICRTKLSANHQLTIPRAAFEASGFEVGDGLRIEVEGEGRVVVTRAKDMSAS